MPDIKKGPPAPHGTGQTEPTLLSPAALFEMAEPTQQLMRMETRCPHRGLPLNPTQIMAYYDPRHATAPNTIHVLSEELAQQGPWNPKLIPLIFSGPTAEPVAPKDRGQYAVLMHDKRTWYVVQMVPAPPTPDETVTT